jgi:hypothetical protein
MESQFENKVPHHASRPVKENRPVVTNALRSGLHPRKLQRSRGESRALVFAEGAR